MQFLCNPEISPGRILFKTFIVMKLLILLVVLTCFQVHAATSYAQNITINVKNASLETVLKQIRKQSGYGLIYTSPIVKQAKTVNLSVEHTALTDVLEKCFLNQPFTFTIKDKTIIVSPKDEEKVNA